MNFLRTLWRWIRHPNPCCFKDDRETLVVGNLAFVKCFNCGSESMPWRVSANKAKAWREDNQDKLKRLIEYNSSL